MKTNTAVLAQWQNTRLINPKLRVRVIEIGLERASFVFSSFEHAKNLLILGPNNTKNSSLKCDFLIFSFE
jgi:hypothetical protein